MIIGSTLNEWETVPLLAGINTNQSDNKNFWDDAKIAEKLTEKYGPKADAAVSAFLKAYPYIFTWETPVMGGYAMAYHCSELPFVFNNIHLSEKITGGGEKAQALADRMSQAWIDFARTGNPGWEAYTTEKGAAMLFDDEPVLAYGHDKDLS